MDKKIRAGILGATGLVGQHFVALLENHPWFTVVTVAASPQSAGKSYAKATSWRMPSPVPANVGSMTVRSVEEDLNAIAREADVVFSAFDMDKEKTKEVESCYAAAGAAVVSTNSAHRWTEDVPLIMPEVNPDHLTLIDVQRKRRGWENGLLVVKPNCSLQSYVPIIHALRQFHPLQVSVTMMQALSGAGKLFDTWPEMLDNVIPYIGGEEEKTESEPMKILGAISNGAIEPAKVPAISSTCVRVPVTYGHMASVAVKFQSKPTASDFLVALDSFENPLDGLNLPTAPAKFITYFEDLDRPQTKTDRNLAGGMGIACGRLREDPLFDWKFICLSHNSVRGAAGGALLTAELLVRRGYIRAKR